MRPLLMKLICDRVEKGPMPFLVRPIARGIARKVKAAFVEPSLVRHLDYMEAELGKTTWFAGNEFSAADLQMSFPVEASAARVLNDSRPKLAAPCRCSSPQPLRRCSTPPKACRVRS